MSLSGLIKAWLPTPVRQSIIALRRSQAMRAYQGLSHQQVFERVYTQGAWGKSADPHHPFCSGEGSRNDAIVQPYVRAVRAWLHDFPTPPHVIDLGCGDFQVGCQVRDACGHYDAFDVVPALIRANQVRYANLDVRFDVLNMVEGPIPKADVAFVRQVMQHLSNADIARIVASLRTSVRFAVVTEHVPLEANFVANLDKRPGPDIRAYQGSGVVLHAAPFDLNHAKPKKICEVELADSRIETWVYEFSV